jgi:hypothetical protein
MCKAIRHPRIQLLPPKLTVDAEDETETTNSAITDGGERQLKIRKEWT